MQDMQDIVVTINNNYVGGIFIDLQKAFDTVDHKMLLSKSEHY